MDSLKEKRDKLRAAHRFSGNIYTDQKIAANTAAEELLSHMYAINQPVRKHPDRHLPQVELFMLNMLMAYHFTGGVLSISKSANEYSNGVMSYRVTTDLIIDSLIKSGWLIEHRGFYGGLKGFNSRVEATSKFIDWLDASDLGIPKTKVNKPSKPIVLKDKNKKVIKIPEHLEQEVEQMAAKVTFFNNELEKSHIDLAISNDELHQLNSQMRRTAIQDVTRESYLFLAKKYLQRKFNNGSLKDGGRFYNAWWITVPKEWRKYITINGCPTAELDYTGMHVQLLFAEKGIEVEVDPYAIDGVDDQFRSVTKLIFMIIFNAPSRSSALKAITTNSKIKESRDGKFPTGIKDFDGYLSLIEREYAPISKYFFSGYGVKLQAFDSAIIENVMLMMLKKHNALTLPIHDSLIVEAKYVQQLKECMIEEFKLFSGGHCGVKQKAVAVYDPKRLKSLVDGYAVRGFNAGVAYDQIEYLKAYVQE